MEKDDPMEEVSKQEKDRAETLLHRLHKASGHPTNRALARLCKDRGVPEWMVKIAYGASSAVPSVHFNCSRRPIGHTL